MADEEKDKPEKVKFRTNIPQRLKFRYATAKKQTHPEYGDSYFYGVVDGENVQRPLFATPSLHALIQYLPVRAGAALEIAKLEDPADARKVVWTVSNGVKEINSADHLDAAFEALRAAEDAKPQEGGQEADRAPRGQDGPQDAPYGKEEDPGPPPDGNGQHANGKVDTSQAYQNHLAHLIRCFQMSELLLTSGMFKTAFTSEDVRALAIHIAIEHAKKPPTEGMLRKVHALAHPQGTNGQQPPPPEDPPVFAGAAHPSSTGDDDLPF